MTAPETFDSLFGELRPWLLRQARWRLGDLTAAEDAVQETLIAAWKAMSTRTEPISRGWLAGILRHKVADQWRRQDRLQESELACEDGHCEREPFDAKGHWEMAPCSWGNPEQALLSEGFWKTLEHCARVMPPAMYRVFVLREVEDLPVEAIARELDLTPNHCNVQLHRARMRLRGCMDTSWGRTVHA
jgi:RNA polymerase sigma-70 factor (ECF subfamily)